MTTALARPTLAAAVATPLARYLLGRAEGSRPTLRRALAFVARWFARVFELGPPELERFPWEKIDRAAILALRAWLLENRKPATASKVLAALRGMLEEALPPRRLRVVWDRIPSIKGSRLRPGRCLEPGEIDRLFAAAASAQPVRAARDSAILALLFFGALRRHEVAALERSALDLEQGTVRVLGKGNRERLVPFKPDVRAYFAAWLAARGDSPGPLLCSVYPRRGGESVRLLALTKGTINRIVAELGELAGLAHVPTHDGRRTLATTMIRKGVPIPTVQRLLGHAQSSTTAAYDRSGDDDARSALDVLHVPTCAVGRHESDPARASAPAS